MQKDQIRGHIAKWPKFLNILQNDQDFGQFTKLSLVSLQNDQDFGQFTKLSLVSLQNVHTASRQMKKKRGNDKT